MVYSLGEGAGNPSHQGRYVNRTLEADWHPGNRERAGSGQTIKTQAPPPLTYFPQQGLPPEDTITFPGPGDRMSKYMSL